VSARFQPLRRAPRTLRIAVAVVAPLVWLAALVLVAIQVRQTDAVATGLALMTVVFAGAVLVFLPVRALRVRRERGS
jgi:hypothetical protein